jgi:hypothetical protein
VYADVDVPNFTKDQVPLSGVSLGDGDVTHTRRTFHSGDQVTALWRIYQLSKSPAQNVTMTITIGNDANKKVFEMIDTRLADRFEPTSTVEEHFRLPLEKLTLGDYVLDIRVSANRVTAARQVRFSKQ